MPAPRKASRALSAVSAMSLGDFPSGSPRALPGDRVVVINVGGVLFQSTKSALSNYDFFQALLSEQIPALKDEDGAYFIDRNAKYFAPLLDFIRTGVLTLHPDLDERQIVAEAAFYMIPLPPCVSGSLTEGFHVFESDYHCFLWVEKDALLPTHVWLTGACFGRAFFRQEVHMPLFTANQSIDVPTMHSRDILNLALFVQHKGLCVRRVGQYGSVCKLLLKWDRRRDMPPLQDLFDGTWVCTPPTGLPFEVTFDFHLNRSLLVYRRFVKDENPPTGGSKGTRAASPVQGGGMARDAMTVELHVQALCPFLFYLHIVGDATTVGVHPPMPPAAPEKGSSPAASRLLATSLSPPYARPLPVFMLIKSNSILLYEQGVWAYFKRNDP